MTCSSGEPCTRIKTYQAASLPQILVRLLRNQQLTPRIDRKNSIELLDGDLGNVLERLNPCVGHHNVQFPEMADRLLEERYDFSRLGRVSGDGDSLGAEGLDFLDDGVGGARGVGVVDDQGGTTGGKLEGILTSHTTARAGDEGHFAVKAGGGGCRRGRHFGDARAVDGYVIEDLVEIGSEMKTEEIAERFAKSALTLIMLYSEGLLEISMSLSKQRMVDFIYSSSKPKPLLVADTLMQSRPRSTACTSVRILTVSN